MLGLTLAVGLALGLGGAYLLFGRSAPDAAVATSDEQRLDVPGAGAGGGADPASRPAAPAQDELVDLDAATTPEAAVSGFLTAQALGDFERSYAFLSEADRLTWATPARWVASQADLYPVEGFEVEQVREDGTVVTLTALRSSADPIIGLVPARARGTWPTVEEGGGFRVAFGQSSYEPLYPSDEGVADAAATWVSTAQGCAAEGAYGGPLYGLPSLEQDLCDAEGEVALGEVGALRDGVTSTTFLEAFGPEVFTWARAVPVTSPIEMTVVMAPIDDRWQVIGLLPAGP